jgi:hypothetical protein
LVELDEQLRKLLPDYVLHQGKEKFGGLRYYWASGEDVPDPEDPEPPTPSRAGEEDEWSGLRGAREIRSRQILRRPCTARLCSAAWL